MINYRLTHINHKINIAFIILACLCYNLNTSQYTSKIPTYKDRQMIILVENIGMENIEQTLSSPNIDPVQDSNYFSPVQPAGIEAITAIYLIAMHQETAPILASKTIIINAMEHKKLFNDFLNLNVNQLCKKYLNTEKFNSVNFLKNFKACCTYIFNNYNLVNQELKNFINNNKDSNKFNSLMDAMLCDLAKDKRFNHAYAPNLLRDINSKECSKIYVEMAINMICYTILYSNWLVKEVSDDFCLLIPKKYLDDIGIKHTNVKYKNHKNKLENKLTTTELNLGLRVNHLKDLSFKHLSNNSNVIKDNYKFNIIKSLKSLFVDKKYAKNIIWSMYLSGHGYYVSFEKIFLPQLIKLKKYYQNILEDNCLSKNLHKEYSNNLNFIRSEIKKLKSLQRKITVNDIDLCSGVIVSMSKEDFKRMLLFFNDNVNTSLLYYSSCFSGGLHLIEPYVKDIQIKEDYIDKLEPIVFNYDIISGTLCENMSVQTLPIIHIPPYYHTKSKTNIGLNCIDFKNKKLKLKTSSLKFKKYFKRAKSQNYRNAQDLKKLVNHLHPYSDNINKDNCQNDPNLSLICNTPLIRFKGSDYFQVSPFKNDDISIISSESLNNEKINLDKHLNLLYTDYSPQILNITIDSKAIISMLPGFAGHVFEYISAPELDLKGVIKPFLYFMEMPAPKVYWIKKLKCKNINELINAKEDTVLNNVIIIRNVINTNKLKECNNKKIKNPTLAYIYFDYDDTTQDKFYKIRWPKFANNNDIDIKKHITLCNSKIELQSYKNEILALKPNLKHYLQDICTKII